MNTDRGGRGRACQGVAARAERSAECRPVGLPAVRAIWRRSPDVVAGTKVALGAQNMYYEANGAFTGEISAAMLLDVGAKYVILGHSERRHILGETDADVNKKTLAALAAGLVPIVCVGELLAEREAGKTADVIRRQFEGSLAGVTAEQIEKAGHRLRAGLGDRHGQSGHAGAGRGGAC